MNNQDKPAYKICQWGDIESGETEIAFSIQKRINGKWEHCIVKGRKFFDSTKEAKATIAELEKENG